jgi:hypothetical protein
VLSLWIVEHLDLVEHILPGIGSGFIGPAPYPFALQQIIMQFAISIHLAALLPGLPDQLGLARIFPVSFAQRVAEPGVKAAGMDAQAATLRTHWKLRAMLGNERGSHFASLAKYAVAFFRMSRSSVTLVSSRFNRLISASLSHRQTALKTSSSTRRANADLRPGPAKPPKPDSPVR